MNIFFTGATGYIGKKLLNALLKSESNNKYYILIRDASKIPEHWKKKVFIVNGDINNFVFDKKNKIDILVHLAACNDNTKKEELENTNIKGTTNICRFAEKHNINNMIYLSSVSVITGNKCSAKNKLNVASPYSSKDDYGLSKIKAEEEVLKTKLNKVVLRTAYVYDNEKYFSVIKNRMKNLKYKIVIGNKNNFWHILNSEKLVGILMNLIEKPYFLEKYLNFITIIADDKPFKIFELYNGIAKDVNVSKPFYLSEKIFNLINYIFTKFFKSIDLKNNVIAVHTETEIFDLTKKIKKRLTNDKNEVECNQTSGSSAVW